MRFRNSLLVLPPPPLVVLCRRVMVSMALKRSIVKQPNAKADLCYVLLTSQNRADIDKAQKSGLRRRV